MGSMRPVGAMDRRRWQYVNWHLEHGYHFDGPVVTTFLIQPHWIAHLVLERGPVNNNHASGTLARRIWLLDAGGAPCVW